MGNKGPGCRQGKSTGCCRQRARNVHQNLRNRGVSHLPEPSPRAVKSDWAPRKKAQWASMGPGHAILRWVPGRYRQSTLSFEGLVALCREPHGPCHSRIGWKLHGCYQQGSWSRERCSNSTVYLTLSPECCRRSKHERQTRTKGSLNRLLKSR